MLFATSCCPRPRALRGIAREEPVTEKQVILGERTRLRPLGEHDLADLVVWRNRHRLRFANSSPIAPEGQAAWYAAYRHRDDDLMYIIETPDGRAVGCVSLYHVDRAGATAEFGRLMIGSAEDEGRGYTTDAGRALLDHARTSLGLHHIYLVVRADNSQAIPFHEHIGFSLDPARDTTVEHDGVRVELIGMSLALTPGEKPPATQPDDLRSPIRVVVVHPGLTPSTYIRLVSPLGWLAERGYVTSTMIGGDQLQSSRGELVDLALRGYSFHRGARLHAEKSLHDADVVIIQRCTSPMGTRAHALARAAGAVVIYETDDNFLAIDKDTLAVGAYYNTSSVRQAFMALLAGSDVVTTSTEILADAFGEFADDVRVLPNSVDFAHIDTRPRPEMPSRLVIGYAGTKTHLADFKCVEPALRRVLDEGGGNVHLRFFGFAPETLLGLPNVEWVPYTEDYPAFLRTLSQVDWSFGIAPLADLPSARGKTDNKYREYGACHIPAIYSDHLVYSPSVTDGRSGLLVPHTEEGWYQGIRRMMADATLRENLARAAYDDVVERYPVAAAAKAWLDTFRDILSRAQR
jgi:RimJ/RimL family protein N-acetyltransferase/glycosyltransferase involved in cell wall biosynthesis